MIKDFKSYFGKPNAKKILNHISENLMIKACTNVEVLSIT